ncbi:MFS transporter [Sphaerobacter thermophilus]|uniref:Major facilitator superfamily MFS_1 n=1 Tax=Sphaerobacter thermophilus (strain ATCC 49802 / DSM 20745 / KCCM 41009 / NCIMB 13125 / S 6022) TaxID=479434 RepID=D1C5L5_SPHTD|nr:MFS transporter [Sphaerobacter thermophilus]ACZ37531.1 major facilitator superfamily MFS_1 [Sphaerobacter thermophilus DSM 20745]
MTSEHRRLVLSVYIPTLLLSFGQGVMIPVLPVYATRLGGDYGLAGVVVAAAWIGTTLFDMPTGLLLPRIGYRRAMLLGAGVFAAATTALGLAEAIPALIILRFLAGVGTAFWGLSRHAFITQAVPPAARGRVISVFGGINRLGHFTGPAVGGLIGKLYGLPTALIVSGALAGMAFVLAVVFVRDLPGTAPASRHGLDLSVLREAVAGNHRNVVAAGTAQIFGQMIRASRQIVIPLYANSLGLDDFQVGQIVSASSLVDVLLFVPAGIVMDRFGRKAAAVPSFTIMGLGMALVPFTETYWTLMAAALLLGFGNGIGSGTMMTLGADLAPPGRTGEFLGIWRFIGDTGQAIAPLAVGQLANLIGLALTAGATAGLGLLAAGTLTFFVRETHQARAAGRTGLARPAKRA